MAYDKTWQFDINRVPGDQTTATRLSQWQLWYIKAFLLGQIGGAASGLWTTYYSCDGTTAGTANDGVDRWGSSFDNTKIVQGSAISTGAKSWFVLKSPSMGGTNVPYYCIISYYGASAQQASVIFSKAAPTGGTTTAAPTATDSFQASGTGNTLPYTFNSSGTLSLNHKFHGMLATDGSFNFLGSRDGSTFFEWLFGFHALVNYRSGDTIPVASLYSYLSTTPGVPAVNGQNFSLSVTNANTSWNTRTPDDTGQPSCVTAILQSPQGIDMMTAANFPTADSIDNTWFDMPIWIVSTTTGSSTVVASIRGRVADMAFGNRTNVPGTVDSATPAFMMAAGLWVPTNAVPSL